MKYPLLLMLALVAVMLVSGCSAPTTPEPTPPLLPASTDTPILTAEPAPTYIEGHDEIPSGKFIFVELWRSNDGASTSGSDCPGAAMIDYPTYSFQNGQLTALALEPVDPATIRGFFGEGQSNHGAMGGGISSFLTPIPSLPHASTYGMVTLHAVYADGTIIATILGETLELKPGEKWEQVTEADPTPECHTTVIDSFTNYGLID